MRTFHSPPDIDIETAHRRDRRDVFEKFGTREMGHHEPIGSASGVEIMPSLLRPHNIVS